jgi:amidase
MTENLSRKTAVELASMIAAKAANPVEDTDWIAGSFLITLMSLPGGSVPAGQTADGLPVGIQVVGPRFEEPLILSVMKIVQQLHPVGWPSHA